MSDDFPVFAQAIRARYAALATEELFVADVSDLAAVYLAAFPPGTNALFRTRTEHDCSACKQFLRHLGCCVALDADGTMRPRRKRRRHALTLNRGNGEARP